MECKICGPIFIGICPHGDYLTQKPRGEELEEMKFELMALEKVYRQNRQYVEDAKAVINSQAKRIADLTAKLEKAKVKVREAGFHIDVVIENGFDDRQTLERLKTANSALFETLKELEGEL
jgi:DNA-binding transcriptional MocR family regulator